MSVCDKILFQMVLHANCLLLTKQPPNILTKAFNVFSWCHSAQVCGCSNLGLGSCLFFNIFFHFLFLFNFKIEHSTLHNWADTEKCYPAKMLSRKTLAYLRVNLRMLGKPSSKVVIMQKCSNLINAAVPHETTVHSFNGFFDKEVTTCVI